MHVRLESLFGAGLWETKDFLLTLTPVLRARGSEEFGFGANCILVCDEAVLFGANEDRDGFAIVVTSNHQYAISAHSDRPTYQALLVGRSSEELASAVRLAVADGGAIAGAWSGSLWLSMLC